jgi:hypothetical protein
MERLDRWRSLVPPAFSISVRENRSIWALATIEDFLLVPARGPSLDALVVFDCRTTIPINLRIQGNDS